MFDDVFALMSHNAAFFYGTVFVFSLVVGSFLNVVIHRLPIMMDKEWTKECREHLEDKDEAESQGEGKKEKAEQEEEERYDLIVPGSACPKCGHQIRAWENIPIVSWLLLKGRCSECANPISIRYPLVELLTGVLSVFVAVHFGFTALTLMYLLLTWGLIALSFIDLDKMLLPDQITLPLVWLALLTSVAGHGLTPSQAIVGAAVGYLSLWSIYWLFKLVTKKEGFGYGDFKLMAVFGAFLGWPNVLLILVLSSVVGAVFAGFIALRQKKSEPVPFGPYIAVAGWIALLWGNQIIDFYLSHYVYVSR